LGLAAAPEAIDQSFVEMTKARAEGKALPSKQAMHQLDASKDLSVLQGSEAAMSNHWLMNRGLDRLSVTYVN
jgi:hypothetical protein